MAARCLFICDHHGVLANAKYPVYPHMRIILLEFKQQNPHVMFCRIPRPSGARRYLRHDMEPPVQIPWIQDIRGYMHAKRSSVAFKTASMAIKAPKADEADVAVWPLDSAEEDIWVCATSGEELRNVKEIMIPYLLRHCAHIPVENIVFFDDLVEKTENVGRMLSVAGILVDVKSGLGADKLAEGLHRISEV